MCFHTLFFLTQIRQNYKLPTWFDRDRLQSHLRNHLTHSQVRPSVHRHRHGRHYAPWHVRRHGWGYPVGLGANLNLLVQNGVQLNWHRRQRCWKRCGRQRERWGWQRHGGRWGWAGRQDAPWELREVRGQRQVAGQVASFILRDEDEGLPSGGAWREGACGQRVGEEGVGGEGVGGQGVRGEGGWRHLVGRGVVQGGGGGNVGGAGVPWEAVFSFHNSIHKRILTLQPWGERSFNWNGDSAIISTISIYVTHFHRVLTCSPLTVLKAKAVGGGLSGGFQIFAKLKSISIKLWCLHWYALIFLNF